MLTCDAARDALALDPTSEEPALREHLATCMNCAAYGRRSQTLDVVLRAELYWTAPSDLTSRLMALAATAPAFVVERRPHRWYVTIVYALTIAIVAISLAVAWQLLGVFVAQLGLADAMTELLALPARAIQQITQIAPASRYLVDVLLRARDQLLWVLMVAILWATLDRWRFTGFVGRRQIA